ncbi:MAG: hypothetical protein EWM72_02759 [Nitrospira sp.]|nr:MAG: hypothetical protein EWM72_02759 [Nitrospira sp.]
MDQNTPPLDDSAKWQVLFKELDRIGREIADMRTIAARFTEAQGLLQTELKGFAIRIEYIIQDISRFRLFQEEGVKFHGMVEVLKNDFDDLAVRVATKIEKESTRTWDMKKMVLQGVIVLALAAVGTLLVLGFQAWLIRPHP